MGFLNVLLDKEGRKAVEVEYEIFRVGIDVTDDGVHGPPLRCRFEHRDPVRERLCFRPNLQPRQGGAVMRRLLHQFSLDVLHDHGCAKCG